MDNARKTNTTPTVPVDGSTHVYVPDDAERTSEAVVSAVTSVANSDPLSLPPLYEAVDPDALDAVFDRSGVDAGVVVSFPFADYDVVVDAGTVLLVE